MESPITTRACCYQEIADLSEAEESKRGKLLAEWLMLKRDREYPDRWRTSVGTKTDLGLFRLAKRAILDGE